jgi:pilus assembly protein Flp/PilA
MKNRLKRLLLDEGGPTAVEYAVLLALIIAACLGAITAMATGTANSFDHSAAEINSAFGS